MNSTKTKQATAFLLFSAMSELMLGQYENANMLNQYDPALHTKLKNLQVNFERVSKKAHTMFEADEQLIFFDLINVIESLLEHATSEKSFSEVIGLIKAWKAGEITMINSKEQLLQVAKEIEA